MKVYSSTTGNRTFILQDRASTQLKTLTVNIPSVGANVITLNWSVPAGEGYKLLVSGTPNLYYNVSGVSYPYLLSGVCRITGSYSGHSVYPFFYDLVVKSPDLVSKSGRVTATAIVNSSITVSASASQSAICAGQSVTLTATGASSYTWSPGGLTGASIVVSPASTTTYTVTGTSAGCTGTGSVSVTVNPAPVVSVSPPPAICAGTSTVLTASGADTYLWSTGETTASITVSPAATTSYSVSGTTAGCTASNSVLVTVNPNPVVSVSPATAICEGASTTLTASGAVSYAWSTGATTSSITVSPASTTTYSVTGTTSGCSGSNSVTVTVNPNPVITISPAVAICAGSTTTLSASGADTYLWSNNATTTGITVSPVSTTTYSVTGTLNGCQGTNSVTVTVNPNPAVTITPVQVSCYGGSDGTAAANVTSGTPAFSYAWNTSPVQTTATASGLPAGPYSVVVTDANGCTGSASQTITQPAVLTASAAVTDAACSGNNGAIDLSPAGGTTPYAYSWTPGGATTQDLSSILAGTYSVLLTDANGCTYTQSYQVASNGSLPAAPGVIDGITYICKSGTAAYSIQAVPGASSYAWSAPAGATISSGQGTAAVTIGFSGTQQSGNVCVAAVNACGSSSAACKALTVVTTKPAVPSAISGPVYVCGYATGLVYACPPVANTQTYNWTFPVGVVITSGAGTNTVTVDLPASFTSGTVRVSAGNCAGTSNNRSLSIGGKPPVPGTISGPVGVCANQSGVSYSIAAVQGATSYAWTSPPGSTITGGQGTTSITVNFGNNSGKFSVRAVNACGQSNARSMNVDIICRIASPENSLVVSPNPTKGLLNISFHASSSAMCRIVVTDLAGRKVYASGYQISEGENKLELNLADLAKGIYMLSFETDEMQEVRKIIVE